MVNCCNHSKNDKSCIRKSDKKSFKLPRKFSRRKCKNPKGFTMRSSCAPYKDCSKRGSKQNGGKRSSKRSKDKTIRKLPKLRKIDDAHKKHKYHLSDPQSKRILAINEGINFEMKNRGLTKKKAAISKKGRFNILRIYRKNNKKDECRKLTSDMKYIDKKYNLGKTKNICKGGGKRGGKYSSKTKKQFLYNPDDPKKSFDVYIDKNPNDTIPIKYTTLNDVKNTILKLERLYKNDKYTHKRIWQVGMILYVRLKVLKDKKPIEFKLAERYFKHLGERSKIKDSDKKKELILRKKHTFKI